MLKSCDTNILLYYADSNCPEHEAAKGYLSSVITDSDFCITDLVLVELYRLLISPKVFSLPYSNKEAAEFCISLRSNKYWRVIECTPGAMDIVWKQTLNKRVSGTKIFDLRIGYTLLLSGVKEFATRNTKDFKEIGFDLVVNPID